MRALKFPITKIGQCELFSLPQILSILVLIGKEPFKLSQIFIKRHKLSDVKTR